MKRYGVAHLVRLLRIQRLTDLGFSLAQIAEMGAADEHPGKAFRTPDADLASTIERLKRVLSPSAITAYKDMLEGCDTDPALVEFDRLPADADERTRAGLARRMVPHARELYTRYPGVQQMKGNARSAARTVQAALADLYNPAQVEVLTRVGRLIETSAEPG